MKLSEISAKISGIVATLPNCLYLRATDIDANISVDEIDLQNKTIVLFNNLPEVGHNIAVTGAVTRSWPIEIKILQLATFDDTTEQSDVIRDACLEVADYIWDRISNDQAVPDVYEYGINFLNELKIYDKTMTGCTLLFDWLAVRTKYNCLPAATPLPS